MKADEEEEEGRESTAMERYHNIGGGEGGWTLVLGLVLVEDDDGHRGYDYDLRQAGGKASHRGRGVGVLIKK